MKKTIGLWCGVLLVINVSAVARTLDVTHSSISLGAINGEIVNDQIEIKKVLSNPVLLTVNQNELDAPLETLLVKGATLIKNQNGEVALLVDSGQQINTAITLSLWLDGRKVGFDGSQSGSAVRLNVPSTFDRLEVRAMTPLTITLPKSYRGVFDFTLDIEGWRQ